MILVLFWVNLFIILTAHESEESVIVHNSVSLYDKFKLIKVLTSACICVCHFGSQHVTLWLCRADHNSNTVQLKNPQQSNNV